MKLKGTNVREAPDGKVTHVIPYGGKTDAAIEMRLVTVTGRDGQWFHVRLADQSTGWMHASVLGSCASSTEDGEPYMYAQPDDALHSRQTEGGNKAPSAGTGASTRLVQSGNCLRREKIGLDDAPYVGSQSRQYLLEIAIEGEAMKGMKQLCCAAALVMLAGGANAAFASGIALKNEMELDIKAVYGVNDTGSTKQVTGALKAASSVTVQPAKFPEYECNRIAVQTANGGAWQLYDGPEPGAATEIVFSMDKANPNGKGVVPLPAD